MKTYLFVLIIGLLVAAAIFAAPALARPTAGETIPWWVVSGGGGGGSGGAVYILGTVGQPAAGFSGDASVDLGAGYWYADDPTAVTLLGFKAVSFAGQVSLSWQTVLETDLVGFNLHRCPQLTSLPDASCTRLNLELIPARALGQPGGAIYAYTDRSLPPAQTAFYWLEVVNVDNQQLTGPLQATGQYGLHLPLILH
jgi:hypothetical protein